MEMAMATHARCPADHLERYAVPGPNHVLFQASLANFNPHAATTVDVRRSRRKVGALSRTC